MSGSAILNEAISYHGSTYDLCKDLELVKIASPWENRLSQLVY